MRDLARTLLAVMAALCLLAALAGAFTNTIGAASITVLVEVAFFCGVMLFAISLNDSY